MDEQIKKMILRLSAVDLKPYLFNQTASIVTLGTAHAFKVASGTFILIGSRLFVATAAHVIRDSPNWAPWILSHKDRLSPSDETRIFKKGKYPGNLPDVGYLELDPGAAAERLGMETCPLERLADRGIGRSLSVLYFVGNPEELVKKEETRSPDGVGVRRVVTPVLMAYLTVPLLESEWPNFRDADVGRDVFLRTADETPEALETGKAMRLPDFGGMSGGGLWDVGFEEKAIWSKESSKLIGIYAGDYKTTPYVSGTQIIHWIRLIFADYPDLRELLVERFPKLTHETNSDEPR